MTRVVLLAFILALIDESAAQTGQWIMRSPLPTPRQEIPHAVLDGKIYVTGGLLVAGIGSTTVEIFTPATNSWSTAAPLPEPLHHHALAETGGRLFVFGGYMGSSFTPTNSVYEYLPDSNRWRARASMPIARGAHIALAAAGKIYVIGGVLSPGGVTGRTDVYDPVDDSWMNLATMPTAREHLAGAVIDSLLYVVGGRTGGNFNTLEAYSPASNTWYPKAPMLTARGGLAAAALRGRMYVFGGENPGVFEQNEEYDPDTNTWRTVAPMPTPRHGIGAATVGDSIFIIGGATVAGFGVTDANEAFTIRLVHADDEQQVPDRVSLYQNYPNPFNPRTVIKFQVPRQNDGGQASSKSVTLRIYDVLGREVATLVNGVTEPGVHEVTWDAGGRASRVYFYKLQAGTFVETKKMVVIH